MNNYNITIIPEDEISWQLQNKIHKNINIAYQSCSGKFISKTYADVVPYARVLKMIDGDVVAYIAIAFDYLKINRKWKKIAELGLGYSSVSGGITEVMDAALKYIKSNTDIDLAIGRSKNEIIYKHVVKKFPTQIHFLPIIGKTLRSKPNDMTIFYNLNMTDKKFNQFVNNIKHQEKIVIKGEPF